MSLKYFKLVYLALLVLPIVGVAASINNLPPASSPDFVIFPARQEVTLAPGKVVTRQLTILNRLPNTTEFNLGLEDVAASADPRQPIAFPTDDRGAYSILNYATLDTRTLTLKPGEEGTVLVKVTLSDDVPAGSLAGLVTVAAHGIGQSGSGATITTRAAAILLVRVDGPVTEQGSLVDFAVTGGMWRFSSGPAPLHFSYENKGNVYLNPYGGIKVKNIFGNTVASVPVDPWFVLPGATRLREVNTPSLGLGWYTATLELNRGYGDVVDTDQTHFLVVPWLWLLGLGIMVVLLLLWRMLKSRS